MEWYEEDIRKVERQKDSLSYHANSLFYGSSTIRLWKTLYEDFKPLHPLNMGFGGSTIEACVHFFPRVMKDLQPEYMVVYAGDNDLGDGRSPEYVHQYFLQLNGQIRSWFPHIPYTYISVKPSISRWNINESIGRANNLIELSISAMSNNTYYLDLYDAMLDDQGLPNKALFESDGLHLSPAGYQLWRNLLAGHISSQVNLDLTAI